MSLKLNKRIIFVFMLLLMLVIIPISFAQDAGDDGNVIGAADDSILTSSVVDESDIVSASADTSDVLSVSGDIYVNKSSTSDTEDGSQQNPYKTIGGAITNSEDGSTIYIAAGNYPEYGLNIVNNLTFVGAGAEDVIIDANQQGRIFDITGTNIEVSISGLTLQNGKVSGTGISDLNYYGGAIKAGIGSSTTNYRVANLTLSGVVFKNNQAPAGGAIYINRGKASGYPSNNLIINDCEFIENVATKHGGAIYTMANTNIMGSNFTGNKLEDPVAATASTANNYGGAIRVDNSYTGTTPTLANLEITGCIFENNSATGKGGALYINTGKSTSTTALINYNAFINNTAKYNSGSSSSLKSNNDTGISAGSNKNVDLNYNWWGYNDVNLTKEISSSFPQPTVYAQFSLTANPTEIEGSATSTIGTAFVWNDETATDIDKLPTRSVSLTTNDTASLTVTGGDVGLISVFSADADGIYIVNATVDNQLSSVTINRNTPLIDSELTVNPTSATIEIDGTYDVSNNVSVVAGALDTIRYVSNDTDVATVDSITGLVTCVKVGVVNITVTAGDGVTYSVDSKNFTVTVDKKTPTITVSDSISIELDEEKVIGATTTSDDEIKYKDIVNETVISIADDKVKGLKVGTAEFTVYVDETETYKAASETVTVTVNKKKTTLTVDPTSLDLTVGDSAKITATFGPDGVGAPSFESDNINVTVDNEGNVQAIGVGTATITVSVGGDDTYAVNSTTIPVEVKKDLGDTIYVSDATGSDTAGDGSEESPYKTITTALTQVTDTRNKIIVLEGTYVTATTYNIDKDVSITGMGNVYLTKSNTGTLFKTQTANLNLSDLTIENINGGNNVNGYVLYAGTSTTADNPLSVIIDNCTIRNSNATGTSRLIYAYNSNLTILHSNFINNHAGTQFFYLSSATFIINYNNIVNDTSTNKFFTGTGIEGNINYNFWGTQEKPTLGTTPAFDNWVVVNPSIDSDTVNVGNDYNLDFKFQYTAEGTTLTDLDDTMPAISFDLASDLGNAFEDSTITMINNEATTKYSATNEGSEVINVTYVDTVASLAFVVNSAPVLLDDVYVDASVATSGDGSESSPVKTIAEGIALAKDGATVHIAAGTYKEHDLTIGNNLTIVGAGADDVIVDADKQGRIFDINGTNIEVAINDLTLINGSTAGSGIKGAGGAIRAGVATGATSDIGSQVVTLNLNDVTFVNNNASSGGAVYISIGKTLAAGKTNNVLNIDGCTFVGNNALNAGAIDSIANTTISNSLFDSNYVTGASNPVGGALRVSQAVSMAVTESTFIANKANRGAAIYYGVGSATNAPLDDSAYITYCAFINNTGENADYGKVIGASGTDKVTKLSNINYNWWGTNDPDFAEIIPSIDTYLPTPTVYAVFNLTADPTVISDGVDSTISTAFVWNDGTDGDIDKLPDRDVVLTTNGTLTVTEGNVGLTSEFSADAEDTYVVNAVVDNLKSSVTIIKSNSLVDPKLTVNPNSTTIEIDDTYDISKNVSVVAGAGVTYRSNDVNIAEVDANGVVTAKAAGTVNITVTAGDGITYSVDSKNFTVTVDKITPTITVSDSISIKIGDEVDIGATTTSDADLVYGNIVNATVIEITSENKVKGLNSGTASFTVSVDETERYKAASETVFVSVSEKGTNLTVEPTSLILEVGGNATIVATVIPSDLTPRFESDNPGVVSVDENGFVLANSVGNAVITVSVGDGTTYAINSTTIPVVVVQELGDSIFVSTAGSDTGGNGSQSAPYATITEALKHVTDAKNQILVLEGSYDTTTPFQITKDVAITGIGQVSLTKNGRGKLFEVYGSTFNLSNVIIENISFNQPSIEYSGNGFVIWSSDDEASVTIDNCTIRDNAVTRSGTSATRMIAISNGDLTVTNCNIINNTVTNLIFVDKGTWIMNYNNIVDNNPEAALLVDGDKLVGGNINYNYWGSQTKPGVGDVKLQFDNWVVVDATIDNETINKGNDYNLNFEFKSTADGTTLTDLEKSMPAISFGLESSLDNTLGDSTIAMIDNEATTTYAADNAGSEVIDVTYGTSVADLTFDVLDSGLIPTEIIIENDTLNLVVGDEAVNVASLKPKEAGNLTYSVSNSSVVKVEDGKIIAVGEGSATVTVSFAGDENYAAAENKTISVSVSPKSKENATYTIDAPAVEEGENATVTVTLPSDATGSVTIGEEIIPVQNGTASAVLSNLPVGNTTVPVTYSGDDKYNPIETTVTVTVNEKPVTPKENLTISATADAITVGEDASIVVTGLENATGNVTVTAEEGIYTAPIVDGTATVIVPGLVKNITATVTYDGDDKYNNASTTVDIVVNPKSKENATYTIDAPEVTEGENATVTVTLPSDATGSVTIGEEIIPVQNGTASAVLSNLPVGNTTVPVTYSGDDKYNPIETTVTVTVNEKPVTPKENLTISATADAITVGEDAVIVVTGLENATGNVTVTAEEGIYTAPIVDGTATVIVPGLVKNITADVTYSGDDKYNNASTTVDIVVNPKEKENATVSIDAPEVTEGENATVTVTLPADATGSVTVGNETVPVVNGTATATVSDLPVGNTTLPITYSGDDKYNPIETTVTVTVEEKPVTPKENLTITASADPITVGEKATIVVSGLKDATGFVTAEVGDGMYKALIVKGSATINVPGLIENTTATISYPGDDKYNNASTTVDIVVNSKSKENATYSIDAPAVSEGENATVTVTLPSDATGTVTVGDEIIPVVNGTASAVLTNLPCGNTTVPVTYSGDNKYNPIETTVTVSVKEDTSDIISAPDVTKYYKGSERFVVTVTDYEGNPLANKTVIININGKDYTRTTDENGTASMALGLPSNTYNVTITVDNQIVNSVVTVLSTVDGTDVVKVYRNGTQYYATFTDSEGKYLASGTIVKFNINGVMYERKVSGDKGQAKLNINLPQGKYIITAINPSNGEMAANNITVLSTIAENKDIVKYYKNATQYTVKILGDDGKAVGAGVDVKFNINGIFYTRQTDASGIAKLSINLPPGDYVITAEYNGCKVANNITVLPVLSAKDITMKYRDGTKFTATLVDGQGKPYAEQKVQFNINGVLYNKETDSKGQAKLNINLLAGEYIITSSYNGANIANKITITA